MNAVRAGFSGPPLPRFSESDRRAVARLRAMAVLALAAASLTACQDDLTGPVLEIDTADSATINSVGPSMDAILSIGEAEIAAAVAAGSSLLMTSVSLDFGAVQVGQTAPVQTADVINISSAPLVMSGAGGATAAPFSTSQNCQGQTLNPGEACQMFFRFAPTTTGSAADTSKISWNGQAFAIALRGEGRAPGLVLSPSAFDFGLVQVGTTVAMTSQVTNISNAPVTMSGAGGGTAAPFQASQNCQGLTLNPGASCQMFFRFTPTTTGAASATSNISWNGVPFSIDLNGTGAAPDLRASGSAFDFGEEPIGAMALQTVDITNEGGVPVTMSGAGGGTAAPFQASQNCQGLTLNPGQSCQMFFRFSPTAPGAASATSSITWSGVSFQFDMTGVGLAAGTPRTKQLRLSPTAFDFGARQLGTTTPYTSDVTNVGTTPIVMSGAGGGTAAPFQASQNCQGRTLNPGESCQMFYRFSPTAVGPFAATSNITWTGEAFLTDLQGMGALPNLRTAGSWVDFGEVAVGTMSPSQQVQISNVGGAPVAMSGSGGGTPAPFSTSQNCQGQTLNTGESCSMFFRFSPTASGAASATSNISWSGVQFAYLLTGVGGSAFPLLATPVGLDFGPTPLGTTTPALTSTITNVGTAAVVMSGAGGGTAAPFATSQNCQGLTLIPGASCSMSFRFSPTVAGAQTATSNISWNGQAMAFDLYGFGGTMTDTEGPVVELVEVVPNPVDAGAVAVIEALVNDQTTGDSNIASIEYQIDGGAWNPMDANDGAFDQSIEEGRAAFTAPMAVGAHELCVRGTDVVGNVGVVDCVTFVVNARNQTAAVTGNGMIKSAAGALRPRPNASGKGKFKIAVTRSSAGAVDGKVRFQLNAGNLRFVSRSITSVVVNPSGDGAIIEGTGRINGSISPSGSDFLFQMWVNDGSPDTFRIRIYYDGSAADLVYDNNFDQPLERGRITIALP